MVFENPVEVILLILFVIIAVWFTSSHYRRKIEQFRRTSAESQRATLRGRVAEQMIPLLPQFTWNPSDARFLGSPVDYIVFDGLSENRDRLSNRPMEIIFVEVKPTARGLGGVELLVKEAVDAKRVKHIVLPYRTEVTE